MMRVSRHTWWSWAIGAGAAAIAVVVTVRRIETTFNVTASTETVQIVSDSFGMPAWELDSVTIIRGVGAQRSAFAGSLEFAPGTRIRLERISSGPLRVAASSAVGRSGVGALFDADGMPVDELANQLIFTVPDLDHRARRGLSVVLPFRGQVELGRGGHGQTGRAMLRSGTVGILGQTVLGSARFDAGGATLDAGDRFVVTDPDGPAVGFVQADERPALTVVYRVLGTRGSVTRFGAKGYTISASVRDRLLKDHVLQGIWLTTVALLGFASRHGRVNAQRQAEGGES